MPNTDVVPCFYKEQNDSWERPAKLLPRAEVREMKLKLLGKFENHGRTFRLKQSAPPQGRQDQLELPDSSQAEAASTISLAECLANVGITPAEVKDHRGTVKRAQYKVRHYIHIFDDAAVLAHWRAGVGHPR